MTVLHDYTGHTRGKTFDSSSFKLLLTPNSPNLLIFERQNQDLSDTRSKILTSESVNFWMQSKPLTSAFLPFHRRTIIQRYDGNSDHLLRFQPMKYILAVS